MGCYPKAYLIYGYEIKNEEEFLSKLEDEVFERYEEATNKDPGFIRGYDGDIQYLVRMNMV